MPLKRTALKLARKLGLGSQEIEEAPETIALQPGLESDDARIVEPGRPHQDFVESEARKYWQEMGQEHNLSKPNQQEIRNAAMPRLVQDLRNRFGSRRHHAVAAMVQHAMERGWITQPFSAANESPSYVEALIQLADDANWLPIEIPLPDHPPPHHPPIYYTIGSVYGRPVPIPKEDAVIRGDYLYENKWTRSRLIKDVDIYPWQGPWHRGIDRGLLDQGRAYYTLSFGFAVGPAYLRPVHIKVHWKDQTHRYVQDYIAVDIRHFHFSSQQPRRKQD